MDVFKFIFLAVLLTECIHSIKAMGLCDFADIFPCDENEGSKYCRSIACKRQNSTKTIQPQTQSTTKESSRDNSTLVNTCCHKEFTGHSTTGQEITNVRTTDPAITTAPLCPPNMVFANCTTCQSTCTNPKDCITSNCTEPETCVCPNGFFLNESDCVPKEECGCFLVGEGVVPINTSHVSSNCLRRCVCGQDGLVCEDDYQLCSPNGVCEERNNLRRCYCKEGFVGDGQTCNRPIDCLDLFNIGSTKSGIYTIKPISWYASAFEVYCNMSGDGGWTVFQRRVNGSVDFYRFWEDYKQGFGFVDHEFWLGNDKIASLTNQTDYQLRIDLVNSLGSPYYATYTLFRIANEDDKYNLTDVGTYGGTAGYDALRDHEGEAFTTRDQDNDVSVPANCAESRHGAWWFSSCRPSNLNGGYFKKITEKSVRWKKLPGDEFNIQYTEMKIRPTED